MDRQALEAFPAIELHKEGDSSQAVVELKTY